MKTKPYAIAMIAGSLLLEYICFKNIYILKMPGNPFVLILPVFFFITGILLFIFSKKRKSNNEEDEL